MMKKMALAAGLLAIIASIGPASAREPVCYIDWTVANEMITSEGLVTGKAITQLAQKRFGKGFIKTYLCYADGRYIYRVFYLEGASTVRQVEVDALKPSF
ncbi:MAG: hypothetical protein R3D33_15300 [Hyphomicrobiaceae bacterium]